MMMMMRSAIATDLHRLVCMAVRAADSESDSGVERCSDIVRYLKSLSLSSKDIRELSREFHPLENLRNHGNPKIRMGVHALYNSWMKTLYSTGRKAPTKTLYSTGRKAPTKKPDHVRSALIKKEHQKSRVQESKTKTGILGLKKNGDQRSQAHEASEIRQNLKKRQTTLPLKLSQNPRFGTTGAIKQNLKKPNSVPATSSRPLDMKVSANPRCCPKNSTEMLELFEIAKKSADVANAKGLLLSKAETSICVDTLSLLLYFPISASSPDTRRVMDKLERLTKHRDRKICNSALTLVHHWNQIIMRDQQRL